MRASSAVRLFTAATVSSLEQLDSCLQQDPLKRLTQERACRRGMTAPQPRWRASTSWTRWSVSARTIYCTHRNWETPCLRSLCAPGTPAAGVQVLQGCMCSTSPGLSQAARLQVIFNKPASVAVAVERQGGTTSVKLPRGKGVVHFETEITLRVGDDGRFTQATLGLDLTLRDVQKQLKANGHPWEIGEA